MFKHAPFKLCLWLSGCLFLYIVLPDSEVIVPELLVAVDLSKSYSEQPNQLMNLHNFDYIIEQAACAQHIESLILVHSAPKNAAKRTVIRQTWGGATIVHPRSGIRLIFLLGAVDNQTLQAQLLLEQQQHGDLLQGNFQDTYYNLTYKHVMALKWCHTHCQAAQRLIKVDDDVFLNSPLLLPQRVGNNTLSSLVHQPQQLLLCSINAKDRVLRSFVSKWRVSFSEYDQYYWPPFCPGFAIVYSRDVVRQLYGAAQRSPYFRLDDVLVTGLLSQRLHISISNLHSFVLYEKQLEKALNAQLQPQEFFVSWHRMSAQQIKRLWTLYGI